MKGNVKQREITLYFFCKIKKQESSKKEKILQKHIYNLKYFVYNIWRQTETKENVT